MSQLDYGIPATRQATFSTPAVLSLVVALAGLSVNGGVWKLLVCLTAIFFGLLGVAVALMPGHRGGLLSVFAILMGVLGALIAVVHIIV